MAYTGRFFGADEAKQIGIISKELETKEQMDQKLYELAQSIASKSPVAILGIKKTIDQHKKESVRKGLEYVRNLNMSLLFTEDTVNSLMASMAKKKAVFPKL